MLLITRRVGEKIMIGDDVVLLLLGDEDVDVQLGPEARDALHQLEGRHLQLLHFKTPRYTNTQIANSSSTSLSSSFYFF